MGRNAIDRGSRDPFRPGDSAFVAALRGRGRKISTRSWPGAHDGKYWRAHTGDYLRFYASALAAC